MAGKDIDWRGSSLDDLKEFPEKARVAAGKQLRKVQSGLLPDDYKPINGWGEGVIEIRIDEDKNAFRVVYVAKFKEKIYVLHGFQKKSQATPREDVAIIKARYKAVIQERRKKE